VVLIPGTRLGPHEVTAQIGAGGMGQVYRATDTTVGRHVAIKILPDERLARFERERKTLASLNHPHIAAIDAVDKSAGMHALVMELVEVRTCPSASRAEQFRSTNGYRGFVVHYHRERDQQSQPALSKLRNRFAVVTGGSAGIGRALAGELAAAGASVLVGSRRPTLGRFEHRRLDLAAKALVDEFASSLLRDGRPIDLLILNAGVHVPWRNVTTADGLELHWQVNYLSNFHLAHQLLELCRRSTLRRVVYVASEAHRLAALPGAPLLGFWYRYAKSKEAAVTFFLRLSELHPELTVRIVSPGYVDSEIHRHKSPPFARFERVRSRPRESEAVAEAGISIGAVVRYLDERGFALR
jgi:NAD(P)-dependent dehydrogenase (short-subunit alcohol dehydrogenase family)